MLALARLILIGGVFLTLLYVALSFWSRSVRAGKLRREWEDTGRPGDRDAYVEAGLRDYDGSLRRKLILGVYVIPITVVGVIIFLTNFN
ncbi:hypothetical protein OO012_07575 [Rhodobacteraceae bacterium KMM 6894]|nr:hypothetical protein [Rhodobacteraceae bacterium KMM 6894]